MVGDQPGRSEAPAAPVDGAAALYFSPAPCLAFTSPPHSVPLCPTSSLWGSSNLLGHQSPQPAASRLPSCGETLTLCLPTPSSSPM